MDARKTALILAAWTLTAALSMKPSEAAGARPVSKSAIAPVNMPTPAPDVIVKLGDAMLEEYHGGDPSRRTVILRQEDSALKVSGPTTRDKKHS